MNNTIEMATEDNAIIHRQAEGKLDGGLTISKPHSASTVIAEELKIPQDRPNKVWPGFSIVLGVPGTFLRVPGFSEDVPYNGANGLLPLGTSEGKFVVEFKRCMVDQAPFKVNGLFDRAGAEA